MPSNKSSERMYFIDAIRVYAILMMFLYHVAMIFVAEWGWHIKDQSKNYTLMELNYWLASFRMPLLFFVSAYISCLILNKINIIQYCTERFNRLVIPLVIWTLLFVAPQIYLERKLQGATDSYFEFYRLFLELEWWPNGSFHWLHLWFIPYLFTYNTVSIPLILYLKKRTKLLNFDKLAYAIPLFILIAAMPYSFLAPRYPVTYDLVNDLARHSFYIFFIFAGILTFLLPNVLIHLEHNRAKYFRAAFISTLIINFIRWNGLEPHQLLQNWLDHPLYYCFALLLNTSSWFWVLTLIGYGKKYLNKKNKIVDYSNNAVYPFYILHQTIIVVIGYYVVQTNDEAAFKFSFILVASFVLILSIYHFFIRPYKTIRFLFGLK